MNPKSFFKIAETWHSCCSRQVNIFVFPESRASKSFVKFFPILKLKIEFHSHKKVVLPKLENSAHLNIVNFKCPKFQEIYKTFLDFIHPFIYSFIYSFTIKLGKSLLMRQGKNAKIAHIYLSWTVSVQSFSEFEETFFSHHHHSSSSSFIITHHHEDRAGRSR